MGRIISPLKSQLSSIGLDFGAYALFLSVTILIQWWTGAFASEFGNHPDEAAHFITGLMAHDFLWQGDWLHPRAFAEQYYIHYPKVALGHWPPFFYLLQALWMSIFPITRTSMVLLMATITAALAALVYREGRSSYGWCAGLGVGVLLLLLRPMQTASGELMADLLVALLCFQAVRSFGRFLDGDRWQDSCAFGFWSSLAIMTKATGIALALLPLSALLFSRRLGLMRCWKFWLPAVLVVVFCAPWYLMTLNMARNGLAENIPFRAFFVKNTVDYSQGTFRIFGIGLMGIAFIGLFAKLIRPSWQGKVSGKWSSFGGWLIAFAVFHCLAPNGMEERYLVPILPIFVLAIAAGVEAIHSQFAWASVRSKLRLIAPVLIGVLLFVGTEAIHPLRPVAGYASTVDEILHDFRDGNLVMLVSSDTSGEGMFISEVALRDRRRNHVVLRASKVLSSSNWLGKNFEMRFANIEDVMHYLIQVPVDFIVLDTTIPKSNELADHRQLLAALESNPQQYVLANKYPVIRANQIIPDAIQVYRLQSSSSCGHRIIRVPMDFTLGKSLEMALP